MSRRRHVPDAERTAIMVDLLRDMHPVTDMSLSHIVLEEVAPGTGWSGSARWADVLILSCWPSNGLSLTGYEIKASKGDLKRELADPGKHERLARYCDAWWLVAWDESVLIETVPAEWGVMVTVEAEYGRDLKVKRKATARTPEPWPRDFVCSLVRNAFVQSPGMAYVARVVRQAADRGLHDGRNSAEAEEKRRLEPLVCLLYGKDRWGRPLEASDPEKVIAAAVLQLQQGWFGLSEADRLLREQEKKT